MVCYSGFSQETSGKHLAFLLSFALLWIFTESKTEAVLQNVENVLLQSFVPVIVIPKKWGHVILLV